MSVQSILNDKNKYFDDLIRSFERDFKTFSRVIKADLAVLIRQGRLERQFIDAMFQDAELSQLIADFVSKYDEVIRFTKELSQQMGVPFVLPRESLELLERIQEQNIQRLLATREPIVNAMIDAGLRSEVEGVSFDVIQNLLDNTIDELGRRISTEIQTGISIFDRTIKSEQFEEAGIEKFVYWGPLDNKTRIECQEALESEYQKTGWTRDDIESFVASNEHRLSFIGGGGFNCRHEFLPFGEK